MGWGNLGIAMGAGVDEMHKQRQSDREDELAAQRRAEFMRKEKEWATQDDVEKRQREISDWYNGSVGRLEKGDHYGVADELSGYHNDTNYLGDSKSRTFEGANGKKYVAEFQMGEGQGMPRLHEVTPQLTRAQLDNVYRHRMEQVDPRQALAHMDKAREFGIKERTAGAAETTARAHTQNADTMEGYRQYQENEPQRIQLGNGQIGMFKGREYLGAYGPARPDHSGGSGGGSGARENWVPLANDSDGVPVFYNQKGIDPKNPQASFVRPDGKPVVNMQGVYDKLTGAKQQRPTPEIPKEVVTKYAENFFNADQKSQEMLMLRHPEVHAAAFGGTGGLRAGNKAQLPPSKDKEFAGLNTINPDAQWDAANKRRAEQERMAEWVRLNNRPRN